MAELEIHHEQEGGEKDPLGQKIGIVTSLLAVCLAIVTIASHRAHTAGVLTKADENDQWSLYQAKKIKLHNLELGVDLAAMISAKDGVTADDTTKRVARFQKEIQRYTKDSDDAQEEARAMEVKVKTWEDRALRYDVGEGLIEIGLVLSSLYFISKKLYFPLIGVVAGGLGIVVALLGLLV
jgi:Domain of unknown function (DUF4337)